MGTPVTSSQLQRWTHRGWVSPPTIRGRGRGRGVEAAYSARAFLECYFLARILKTMKLPLDEAGWYVWVLGLGDTERVRRFLLDELHARVELGVALNRPGRRRREIEQAIDAAARSRPLRGLRTFLTHAQTVRAVGLITRLRAGLPAQEQDTLGVGGLDDLRDAFAQEAWQQLRNALPAVTLPESPPEHDLPSLKELPHLLSANLDPTPVIQALEQWQAPWLRGICNEGQYLLDEVLENLLGRRELLPVEGFLQYVRSQLDPARRAEWEAFRRTRGWTSPPPPPLWRWPEFKPLFTSASNKSGGPNDRRA